MSTTIREKPKGSREWWVFICYEGKRISRKVGTKTDAIKVAKKIKERLFFYKNQQEQMPLEMVKLNRYISRGIRHSLNGNKQGQHWEDLVDYNLEDLKKHLEKHFKAGMTWENYGSWHIDHKIPISAFVFDSSNDRGFKKCWALSNLQPLWAKENLKKANKILAPFNTPTAPYHKKRA